MNLIFVYITCKNKEEAILIGKSLVTSKLAGCVNILEQMTSIYEWKGQLEVSEEVILIAKTNESLFNEIIFHVKKIHSYTTPCILSIPIQNGNEEYIKWLESGLKKNTTDEHR
ncbi:MAG: divalent-cation tolerance protein CutA [Leptospiraceae bacterium]|nr:divalent-cation tolerance protein CutA [Leptospiraceae bacterium]